MKSDYNILQKVNKSQVFFFLERKIMTVLFHNLFLANLHFVPVKIAALYTYSMCILNFKYLII